MKNKAKKLTFKLSSQLLLILLTGACVTTAPSSTELAYEKAHDLFVHSRYADAVESFDSLINSGALLETDPLLARSYRYRGECHKALERFTLARLDFESACRLARSLGGAYPGGGRIVLECSMARGDTLVHEGSIFTADKLYSDLIEANPPLDFKDGLLYRRHICSRLLGRSDGSMFLAAMTGRDSFDTRALDREFLGIDAPKHEPSPRPGVDPLAAYSAGDYILLPRSKWNASPIRSNITPMSTIQKITVHHSGNSWTENDLGATARKIASYQKYHQDTNNWADIGYHFLIDRLGRVWEGRPLRFQGAHAGNERLNRGNIGISLMGNFNEQRLNNEQSTALVALISDLRSRYDLPSSRIVTHLELKSTDCPGTHLQRFVDQLRRGNLIPVMPARAP